jgi:hypothetical protein
VKFSVWHFYDGETPNEDHTLDLPNLLAMWRTLGRPIHISDTADVFPIEGTLFVYFTDEQGKQLSDAQIRLWAEPLPKYLTVWKHVPYRDPRPRKHIKPALDQLLLLDWAERERQPVREDDGLTWRVPLPLLGPNRYVRITLYAGETPISHAQFDAWCDLHLKEEN